MSAERIIIVGGGAAGFFSAITCASAAPRKEVVLLEKGPQFLAKVRISGGGRCNVTHACFDARALTTRYPRGERALIGAFQKFQARDTVTWFAERGVTLKTEEDGRMFPDTDSSETIVNCLTEAAHLAGVKLLPNHGVESITKNAAGEFVLKLNGDNGTMTARRVLLATGGCRAAAAGQLAVTLGHTLIAPVPSLFTFHIATPWLQPLAGTTVEMVEASVPSAGLRERGPLLVTHWGLSGPAILRTSAWGARVLAERDYKFPLLINWLPERSEESIRNHLAHFVQEQPARLVVNATIPPLTARLWEQLVLAAGIARETRWAELSRAATHKLVQQLVRTELPVQSKSLNKDEFVTCGGVPLGEVNFKTMESRVCPGLHFAGELLDIDGITGGFNFQAAWTTGWIAGNAMAAE